MEEKVTHWRKLTNPHYLGAHDLQPGQEVKVTIEKVQVEKVKGTDGKDEDCVVCYFVGAKKPMILNKTNMKMIQKVHATPYIEQWAGKAVYLRPEKVKAFGEVVDALRVMNKK